MKTIVITGASGNMGSEVLKQLAELNKYKCRILLRDKKQNKKLAKKLAHTSPNTEILFGDLINCNDCIKLVEDADYIIHCAAIIPPNADHHPDETYASNYIGTVNLLTAFSQSKQAHIGKFVYIGSVAEYGNRTFKHPWGRVGDPLLPSAFDNYAATKIRAEREVIESSLPYWVSLRQSGVLYDTVLMKNMDDGLMFHTGWNTPIEWATARTSGLLIKNLIEYTEAGTLPPHFWRRVYNIGNGKDARVTGYETLDRGFKMMGQGVEAVFEPHWNAQRNFHCMWFSDSAVLNEYLHFQEESFESFFQKLEKKYWYFKLGKPFPALIKRFAIMPLLKTCNAPLFWLKAGLKDRVRAFFGSYEHYHTIPTQWNNYHLLCKNRNPETGDPLDYAMLKDEHSAAAQALLLNHGYDEQKPEQALGLADIQAAAAFRGGRCISETMQTGDLYTPLQWECHNGHTFSATPYLILKTGHWCPVCCAAPPWNFGKAAEKSPFYAQVWYDDHDKDEDSFYDEHCFRDIQTIGQN